MDTWKQRANIRIGELVECCCETEWLSTGQWCEIGQKVFPKRMSSVRIKTAAKTSLVCFIRVHLWKVGFCCRRVICSFWPRFHYNGDWIVGISFFSFFTSPLLFVLTQSTYWDIAKNKAVLGVFLGLPVGTFFRRRVNECAGYPENLVTIGNGFAQVCQFVIYDLLLLCLGANSIKVTKLNYFHSWPVGTFFPKQAWGKHFHLYTDFITYPVPRTCGNRKRRRVCHFAVQ